MLKVVGASSEQTRLSSYVLATLSICGIIIIIFGGKIGSFEEEDGIYSATVYWNKFGYRLEFWGQSNSLEEIPRGSARAYYNSDMYGNGWSKLEIETNEFDPDWVQAQSAGLLEGSLTWQHIYYHWQNTINSICEHYEDECEQIRELIKINTVHIREKLEESSESDPFWHQIRLYYSQLDGIEMGWRYAVKRSLQNYEIPSEDFIWMNMANDIFDLKQKLGFTFDDSFKNFTLSSAIFKLVNASTDPVIHIAHHTGDTYRAMLRTVKHYNFNFHITNSKISDLVPGTTLTFTSYPGVITSLDDFYIITSKQSKHSMVITSTPLNSIRDFSKDVHLENKLFSSPRVMAANRIALTGLQWMKTFSHNLLEMNNRQWLIFDGTKLEQLGKNVEGLLWLVEQISGVVRGMDVTKVLLNNSFWASFGAVYFNDTNESFDVKKENLQYFKSSEAQLFNSCLKGCNTLEELVQIFQHGLQVSESNFGIRADLYQENPKAYGIIDAKYLTYVSSGIKELKIQSGPAFYLDVEKLDETILPFKWSSSKFNEISHVGQPDEWNFQAMQPAWVWV